MKKLFVGILMVCLVGMVGCMGPFVDIIDVDKNIVEEIKLYTDKKILTQKDIIIIGPVEATSCQYLIWHATASNENCINQLKMKAFNVGANALIFGMTQKESATFIPSKGINRNCWTTVDCSAVAIIINNN